MLFETIDKFVTKSWRAWNLKKVFFFSFLNKIARLSFINVSGSSVFQIY